MKELRPSEAERILSQEDHITLTGRIYQKTEKQDYQVLYLKNNSIIYHQQSLKESKIIIYDEKKKKLDIGDILIADGKIRFFENARNPGNFDMKLYYQSQGIHASVWAESVGKVKNNDSTLYEKIRNILYKFRCTWKKNLCNVMGEKDGNILSAMILGEKAQIDQEQKELYRVNGIGHILAISGLHLSFVGLGMYRIFRRISGSYAIGGIAGITFLICYILMIGFTISAVRALVMFLFRVGADMTGRNYDSITALSFAMAIVLVWRPLSVYDGGFWMSFGAVLAIIVILPAFSELPLEGVWASIGINLVIFPVLLYYFYEFPLYSIVLNLFVIPTMSILLFMGITGSLIYWVFVPGGELTLKLCKMILAVYDMSCYGIMKLPCARIVTGQPEKWQIVLYYICLLIAGIWYIRQRKQGKKGLKNYKNFSVTFVFLCIGIFLMSMRFGESGKLMLTMLDVGQGDGIYIKGPKGGNYFMDGGSSDVKNVGQYRIEPFLLSKGVKKLECVFISHGDSDHLSGIEEMIERKEIGVEIGKIVFPVREVWDEKLKELAKKAMENRIPIATIEPGKSIKEKDMLLTCISPDHNFTGESGNEASMVLALSYHNFDMLLTGDVEGAGEKQLIGELKEKGTFKILKAAHHGSKNSTGEEFLETVKPAYTLISAGIGNRYGHPHKETLERLEKAESKVYSTKDCGAITVEVEESKFIIEYFVTKK